MKVASMADNATNALNRPAIAPPEGLVSNFKNPTNRGYIITTVGSVLISLMVIFFAVRIYAKAWIQKKLWWDDLTCGLAAATAIVYFVACILCVKEGTGIHLWDRKVESVGHDFLLASYMTTILTAPALGFAKITYFTMYYRLFRPNRTIRYLIFIGGIATAVFYTGSTIAQFVFMTPRPGETFVSHFRSSIQRKILYFSVPHSAVGACIDLYILVLPIVAVLQLKLATKSKIGIVLIFMTGSLAVMASFLSMYYRILLNKTNDLTWALLPVILLCLAEVCIGVICSCMPLLPGTIRHHASHIATIQSLLSSPVKYFYFSNRRSRSVSSTEPKPLILYPSKDKSEYSELGIGMVKCGGDRNRSLEGLQQYEVESQGTNTLPAFVGEEDRIHLKQEVTIIRQ